MNNNTTAIAAAVLVLGALAGCSGSPRGGDAVVNPDGATSDLVLDVVSGDLGEDRVPDRDIVTDVQADTVPKDVGIHDADVDCGRDNVDGDILGDLFDLDTADSGPPDLLIDAGPDARPDLEPADLDMADKEEDVEVEEPYDCPTGQDGKKELMPPCPYGDVFADFMTYFDSAPLQFELYSTGTNPGLPDGFVATEGQSLALLRFYWRDPWTNMFADWIGCPPEWPGCKACGGHCFPPQGYVHVIDLATLTVVYSAKEELPQELLSVETCKAQNGSTIINCYQVKVPELETKVVFLTVGQWSTGTSSSIPDSLRAYHIDAVFPAEVIGLIPIPLF